MWHLYKCAQLFSLLIFLKGLSEIGRKLRICVAKIPPNWFETKMCVSFDELTLTCIILEHLVHVFMSYIASSKHKEDWENSWQFATVVVISVLAILFVSEAYHLHLGDMPVICIYSICPEFRLSTQLIKPNYLIILFVG